MCKTWGSKCYFYINPKTIRNGHCHDKLRNTGRVGVFLGYSNDTTKYIKLYSRELSYTGHSSRVIIDETQKGGNLDLRLRNCIAGPQGPQNVVPDRKPRCRPNMEKSIDPISPWTIIPTFLAVAGPSFQIQSQSIPNIPKDDNRHTHIENPEDFEIGPTIHPEIPSAIETGTKPPADVDAKLLLSLPILDNQNNLDPEPQSISVIMTNPDNQHYNPPSRSISPLAEHNTNNPHSCSLSIQTIESGTSTRNEEHEHRYQFRKRKKNNPDDEVDERQAKVTKALIAITTQNPDEGDIEHAMVAIPNAFRIDSELKDKIASNLTVLLADIQEHPDDIALPALAVLGIKIPRTYKEAISDPQYGSEW
jgi:hypothetical protein